MAWAGTLTDFKNGVTWTGAANSDTTPAFTLTGGKYGVVTSSTGTASATLQIKDADGNFVAVGAAVTTYGTFDVPAGTYQVVMGATAGTAAGGVLPIPYRQA